MDFYLRCNFLKCRAQLKERAVVTTCSHIFCLQCAENLRLSPPSSDPRQCPACNTVLSNPDDAAMTILNPTEDYKTSVLSGLNPNTILECAGRALLFWSYQTNQEILYQEFLGRTLTEKYATQMDRVIHNANAEISTLQTKLSDMQKEQDNLQKKNQELVDMYREKSKKFTQITNLYNLLKSRSMRPQIQSAASDSISKALKSLVPQNLQSSSSTRPPGVSPSSRQQDGFPLDGVERIHRYQRSGTGSSKEARRTDMAAMPPPNRPGTARNRNIPKATPQHRTRLTGPSRPSTVTSHLPEDSVMFQRFQGDQCQQMERNPKRRTFFNQTIT
ncbi:cyclin [Aspergillus ambiguus]|uniref:uncharacterized protein n=1 Tax=Aspergillus ambiguus TaxID=176160 RepID=UPI003CCDA0E0